MRRYFLSPRGAYRILEGYCVSVIEFLYLCFFPCIQCGPWLNTPAGQTRDAHLALYKAANWQSLGPKIFI
jgi:hypothetical protein